MATTKLVQQIKELLSKPPLPISENGADAAQAGGEIPSAPSIDIPLIYIRDDVARLYQHSKRAAEEFSTFSLTAKYCVGLARYAQNPLNEFAALGADITAITFDEEDQHLVRVLPCQW
jgi:transcription elongation factor SPT6